MQLDNSVAGINQHSGYIYIIQGQLNSTRYTDAGVIDTSKSVAYQLITNGYKNLLWAYI